MNLVKYKISSDRYNDLVIPVKYWKTYDDLSDVPDKWYIQFDDHLIWDAILTYSTIEIQKRDDTCWVCLEDGEQYFIVSPCHHNNICLNCYKVIQDKC